MNYKKIYDDIVQKRMIDPCDAEYTENHHVIPKSLGGSDDASNVVTLSAREHFLCHLLLTKIYAEGTPEWCKMIKAFAYMCWAQSDEQQRYVNSRFYQTLKTSFSKAQSIQQSGEKNSQHNTMWIFNEELKLSKKIDKNESIPAGWQKGYVLDWPKYFAEKSKKNNQQKKHREKLDKLKNIMYYYRDNEISMRELSKKFNVGHNVYVSFERYFKDEYREIVKTKPMNSNTTKGRY
jgi:hypothetical protein